MSAVLQIPVLAGPTASGKTALSLEVAEAMNLEIISADAMMVYRGMDIGTAKPSAEERQKIPHHLIDIREPHQNFSVQDWVLQCEDVIANILSHNKVPLVVGGTGFYIRALSQGLPTTPASDIQTMTALQTELLERGLDVMLQELHIASPQDATRTERNPRRVLRALEVLRGTGKAPASFSLRHPKFKFKKIVLMPTRAKLEENILRRSQAMIEAGLIIEAKKLLPIFLRNGTRPTSMQAIGYKQAFDHLLGTTRPDGTQEEIGLDETARRIALATRQYAKRQETWFKAEPNATLVENAAAAKILLTEAIQRLTNP